MEDTVLNNIKVPIDWICIYRQIQYLLVEYGKEAIQGCDNVCTSKNKNIIELWNLFKNGVYIYNKGDITAADKIYKFITRQLQALDNINVGTSIYKVEDSDVQITCTGNDYEFTDIKEEFEFKLKDGSTLDFKDDGLGKNVILEIISNKSIIIGSKEDKSEIGFTFELENPIDAAWLSYNSLNKTLIIRENKIAARVANFTLIQYESGNVLKGTVLQELNKYSYKYTIDVYPENIEIPAEGGEIPFTINSYKELVNESGEVIGDKIDVIYNAYSSISYFTVNGNKVSAKPNVENIRIGSIIIERDEVGISGNKKIDLYQDSLNKEIRYKFSVTADKNKIDVNGTEPILVSIESYKETYINGISQEDRTDVNYTIIADKGYLKNHGSDRNKWYMDANTTTNVRKDSLIATQAESNKSDIIEVTQDAAVETFEYSFTCDQSSIQVYSNGLNTIVNIQSYKQYFVNGKPTTKEAIPYSGSVITGSDFVQISEALPNSITILQNNSENERSGKILYKQNVANGKELELRINQTGASISYRYTFTISNTSGVETSNVNLNKEANSNQDLIVASYKKKYINDVTDDIQIAVNFSITSPLTGTISTYVSANANVGTRQINITSILNDTEETLTGSFIVTQDENKITAENNKIISVTKERSVFSYDWFLEIDKTHFDVAARTSDIQKYSVIRNEMRKNINGNYHSTVYNLPVEQITSTDWINISNKNDSQFTVSENVNISRYRDGNITVRLVNNPATTVEITVRQAGATSRTTYYFDTSIFDTLTPSNQSTSMPFKLRHLTYLNDVIVEDIDQTGIDKVNMKGVSGCGQACSDWNGSANNYDKHLYCSYYGSGAASSAYFNFVSDSNLYKENARAVYSPYEEYAINLLSLNSTNNIYNWFYHYIPSNLKCILADLIKIFIKVHNNNYELRKCIFNINLFQSLIGANFFNLTKEYNLFLKYITTYLNNYFKDNDIRYEYDINKIDELGHVTLNVKPCQNKVNDMFEVDVDKGRLELNPTDDKFELDFEIKNNNLLITKDGYNK